METGTHREPGEEWGVRGEEWTRLDSLLALARHAHREEMTEERRVRIRERVLERLDRLERRRRRVRLFMFAASTAFLAACLVMLVRRELEHL